MKYNEVRGQIKSGDTLAWTHRSWGSWYDIQMQLVRMGTRSEYSHIGVAWVIGGRVFVIEAVVPLIRIFPLSKEVPFYWVPCGDKYWNDDVESLALSKVGEAYSKWQAISAWLNKLKTGEDKLWQCAEFTNTILTAGGIFKQGEVQSTPAALMQKMVEMDYQIHWVE